MSSNPKIIIPGLLDNYFDFLLEKAKKQQENHPITKKFTHQPVFSGSLKFDIRACSSDPHTFDLEVHLIHFKKYPKIQLAFSHITTTLQFEKYDDSKWKLGALMQKYRRIEKHQDQFNLALFQWQFAIDDQEFLAFSQTEV